MGFMTPQCPECGEEYAVVGALHWHLRRAHGYGPQEAYEAAGAAFEHLSDEWLEGQRRDAERDYGRRGIG